MEICVSECVLWDIAGVISWLCPPILCLSENKKCFEYILSWLPDFLDEIVGFNILSVTVSVAPLRSPLPWSDPRFSERAICPELDLVRGHIGNYRFWFSCIPVEQLRRKPTLGTYRWPRNHFRVTEIGFWVEFSLVLGGALYWIVVSVFRLGFMKNALYLGVHFSIQSTPQNLGKLTSEPTFAHSKVLFRPLLSMKRTITF